MDKRQAEKTAKQLSCRFDVYFKNTFSTHAGKHWRIKSPDTAGDVASRTITANCEVARVLNSNPSIYAFKFHVASAEPRYVEAAFFPTGLRQELNQFFGGKLQIVNEFVDLRKGQLFFSFKEKASKQYYHFSFHCD